MKNLSETPISIYRLCIPYQDPNVFLIIYSYILKTAMVYKISNKYKKKTFSSEGWILLQNSIKILK